jgi:hypothetical protein
MMSRSGHPACAERRRSAQRRARLVEQRHRTLSGYHGIRNGVGVLLVGISRRADAALELDTAALLHDVRGLVSGGVQIWAARECDSVPRRVRTCTYVTRGRAGLAADMSPDPVHRTGMDWPETAGDEITVRQRTAGAAHALRGDLLRPSGVLSLPAGDVAPPLHGHWR